METDSRERCHNCLSVQTVVKGVTSVCTDRHFIDLRSIQILVHEIHQIDQAKQGWFIT